MAGLLDMAGLIAPYTQQRLGQNTLEIPQQFQPKSHNTLELPSNSATHQPQMTPEQQQQFVQMLNYFLLGGNK